MFCRYCGNEVQADAFACLKCGCDPRAGKAYCPNCGTQVNEQQDTCSNCGWILKYQPAITGAPINLKKIPDRTMAGMLAVFLGIGLHHFYMGNVRAGILHLLVTIATCGIIGSLISVIEGYKYLSMSDEEFYYTYILNKKDWF